MAKKRENHTVIHYLLTVMVTVLRGGLGSFVWILIAIAGYLVFESHRSPFDIAIGIPLLLIGVGLSLQALWTIVLSIFSLRFNRQVCPLCSEVE